MSFSNVAILNEKLKSLPEEIGERMVEYIIQHFEEIESEAHWDAQFEKSSGRLAEMARQAKEEMAEGKAEMMDYERL